MATTYHDSAFGARSIGERTDAAGAPVDDVSAEEDRYAQLLYTQGIVQPQDSFLVAGASGWNVTVGSGGSKTDYVLLGGVNAGQGNYIVRLPADDTFAVNASDPALDRIDEIYVVVLDNAYDSSSRALPRLAYRDGTAAASPSAPGPDGTWDAYMLLATITVPGGSANISAATITDERIISALSMMGDERLTVNADGKTQVVAPTGTEVVVKIGSNSVGAFSSTGLDMKGNAITSVGDVDGVDLSAHAHTGADGSSQMAHGNLTGMTSGNPHTQYLLNSAFTKAAVDALNVDADTLDGLHASGLALAGHNHDGAYLGLTATATAALKWATSRTLTLTGDVSGSQAFDGSANASLSVTVADDSHLHENSYYNKNLSNARYYGDQSSGGHVLTISTSPASGGSDGDIWIKV